VLTAFLPSANVLARAFGSVPRGVLIELFLKYVCILLHIGRIRMDIDNPGVTWDLDKT
jgi:hypothetical protein